MNKRAKFKVVENVNIAKDVFKMILEGDTKDVTKAGQFINIELESLYLRRPISVCDFDDKTVNSVSKKFEQVKLWQD